MSDKNKPHATRCGAKTRSGEPCKNWAMSNGRCRMHGGKSTGPPPDKMRGNKNAVKTGEYETIWLDTLDDDERVFFDAINTDAAKQIDEEIRLITIRERRMMKRIQALNKQKQVLEEITDSDEFGVTKRYVDVSVRIQQIEEALTRVQREKVRLIELKHRIESVTGQDDGSLDALAEAIRMSAERLGGGLQ